jgi:hypothetical protein
MMNFFAKRSWSDTVINRTKCDWSAARQGKDRKKKSGARQGPGGFVEAQTLLDGQIDIVKHE